MAPQLSPTDPIADVRERVIARRFAERIKHQDMALLIAKQAQRYAVALAAGADANDCFEAVDLLETIAKLTECDDVAELAADVRRAMPVQMEWAA